MLRDVLDNLACPVCGEPLAERSGALSCGLRHSFDVARQGYVNLLPGDASPGTADTPAMVEARATFLGRGHFSATADAVAEAAAEALADGAPGCAVEIGAGTGYYLAAALDRLPERSGLALDISKAAAKRAARAHERIGAVVCDAWGRLPVRDGAAALVLDVFAPRNAAEFARILAPGGALVVVTPTQRHLHEIVGPLGMIAVDAEKDRRLAEQLGDVFELTGSVAVEERMMLGRDDLIAVASMGPSAWHAGEELAARVDALALPQEVTLSVIVSAYRPTGSR
ncbi:MAG: methyltransferase domain-containing protein [Actinobacteria bacterium]|nr:MAG: methyltransferase domain-containing protein [Actinomycetota bacterium]